jgi:hypothetical protein
MSLSPDRPLALPSTPGPDAARCGEASRLPLPPCCGCCCCWWGWEPAGPPLLSSSAQPSPPPGPLPDCHSRLLPSPVSARSSCTLGLLGLDVAAAALAKFPVLPHSSPALLLGCWWCMPGAGAPPGRPLGTASTDQLARLPVLAAAAAAAPPLAPLPPSQSELPKSRKPPPALAPLLLAAAARAPPACLTGLGAAEAARESGPPAQARAGNRGRCTGFKGCSITHAARAIFRPASGCSKRGASPGTVPPTLPSMLLQRPLSKAGAPRPPPSGAEDPASAPDAGGTSQPSLTVVAVGLRRGSPLAAVAISEASPAAAAAAAPAVAAWPAAEAGSGGKSFRRSNSPCCSDSSSKLSLRSCCACCDSKPCRPEKPAAGAPPPARVAAHSSSAAAVGAMLPAAKCCWCR